LFGSIAVNPHSSKLLGYVLIFLLHPMSSHPLIPSCHRCQSTQGGKKASGIGRELGPWGLMNYLEVKQVTSYESPEPYGWYNV
jgi:hypothetical protein